MSADNQSENTSQTTNPQTPGGAAQVGEGAPVFVNDAIEFSRGPYQTVTGGDLIVRVKHRAYLWCFGFALLYLLLFIIGRWVSVWFPAPYQAWLDFCMPLAEYVGGLTPRAERITGQLIENGYPERADDALHAIGMAKVLMLPVFVCMMAGCYAAAPPSPVFVYCTRWTHIKIWLRMFLGLVMCFALAMLFVWGLEIKSGETFGGEFREADFLARHGKYHYGNFAMFADLMGMFVISIFLSLGVLALAGMRPIRFIFVKQKPEGVQDYATLIKWREKRDREENADKTDNNSGDNADKTTNPQN